VVTGSGIAPFLPIPSQPLGWKLPLGIFLFCFRLPLLIFVCLSYFLLLQWLPIGSLGKKASLWCILGVPSIWWIDLQVDGVRKGCVAFPFHSLHAEAELTKSDSSDRSQNSTKPVCPAPAPSSPPPSPPPSTRSTWQPSSTPSSQSRTRTRAASNTSPFSRLSCAHLPPRK
jgi:hypothetical protein